MGTQYVRSLCRVAGLILLLVTPRTQPAAIVTALSACPDKPNCVSSQARDPAHAIEAFRFSGTPEEALRRLTVALTSEPRISIVAAQGNYLHAEARSLVFRFVDDVEFLIDSEHGLIQVRSASRIGYSDLGVNRRRVERLRRAFMQAQ